MASNSKYQKLVEEALEFYCVSNPDLVEELMKIINLGKREAHFNKVLQRKKGIYAEAQAGLMNAFYEDREDRWNGAV